MGNTLNIPQTIFSVFYAIFWGGIFNVLGRWKAFNFGLIFDEDVKHVTKRISLSLLFFNILPIIFFVIISFILQEHDICDLQRDYWFEVSSIVLSGVIPAFAIFGFYRVWLGITESCARQLYANKHNIHLKYIPYYGAEYKPEPSLESLGIAPSCVLSWKKNSMAGVGYIILGFLGAIFPWFIFILLILIIASLFVWSCWGNTIQSLRR